MKAQMGSGFVFTAFAAFQKSNIAIQHAVQFADLGFQLPILIV